jgi:hypothetical protein
MTTRRHFLAALLALPFVRPLLARTLPQRYYLRLYTAPWYVVERFPSGIRITVQNPTPQEMHVKELSDKQAIVWIETDYG